MALLRRVAPLTVAALLVAGLAWTSPGSTQAASSQRYEEKGLDSCAAPTHSQMADFYAYTPWYWWGIYVGGENRACVSSNLTKSWVDTEIASGWGLLPIYVGKQAPCSKLVNSTKMSSNTTTAYNQGVSAGKDAYVAIIGLGMVTTAPIVFDLEPFDTSNSACLASVEAFLRGWTAYLASDPDPQDAGIYGSGCGSALSSYWSLSPRADFIWGADEDFVTNVYDMGCVSTSIWPNRHKQYNLNSNLTENGTTLKVDRNCAQGPIYGSTYHHSDICRT